MIAPKIKKFILKCMNPVVRLPPDLKLCLLFFLSHLERSFESSCNGLLRSRVRRKKSLEVVKSSNDDFNQDSAIEIIQDEKINIRPGWGVEYYRRISDLIHFVTLVKYLLVLMILENNSWPDRWACHLWGRLGIHEALVDYLPFAGFILILTVVAWCYITRVSDIQTVLDLVMFLLCSSETIEKEKLAMAKLNRQQVRHERRGVVQLSALQKALFYQVRYENCTIYKQRPNRTEEFRAKLIGFLNLDISCTLMQGFIVLSFSIPIAFNSMIFDHNYVKVYPTCCPLLEKVMRESKVSRWQITWDICEQRKLTTFFDLLDNFLFYINSLFSFLFPSAICILIVKDMILQWQLIDTRIKLLLAAYRRKQMTQLSFGSGRSFDGGSSFSFNHDTSSLHLKWMRLEANIDRDLQDRLNMDTTDVQALIIDFFEGFWRTNKITGVILSEMILFFGSIILLAAYLSFKIPDFYDQLAMPYLLAGMYFMFFVASGIMLSLKRVVDRSYLDICSLMVLDKSPNVLKWAHIVDSYIHKTGTAFPIFHGIRYNWNVVFSFTASSISFLIIVKTYQRYYDDSFSA